MTNYRGYQIMEDEDFDGVRLFFIEHQNGDFSEFSTFNEAKRFVDNLSKAMHEVRNDPR